MARSRAERDLAALVSESKRLVRRGRRRLDPNAHAELAAVMAEAKGALSSAEPTRIAQATSALEAASSLHLARFRKALWRESLEVVAAAIVLALLVRASVTEAFRIPSGSMVPTLLPGDVVLVDKTAYGISLPLLGMIWDGKQPGRGDVIVFESPDHPGQTMIKRVAGIGGDTVEIVDETVYINEEPQERVLVADRFEYWNFRDDLRYWHPESGHLFLEELGGRRHGTVHSRLLPRPRPAEGPFVVPNGHLFVLGDHRDDSDDGRSRGGWYVPLESVRGRASRILFSRGKQAPTEEGFRPGRFWLAVDGTVEGGDRPLEDAAIHWGRILDPGEDGDPSPDPYVGEDDSTGQRDVHGAGSHRR